MTLLRNLYGVPSAPKSKLFFPRSTSQVSNSIPTDVLPSWSLRGRPWSAVSDLAACHLTRAAAAEETRRWRAAQTRAATAVAVRAEEEEQEEEEDEPAGGASSLRAGDGGVIHPHPLFAAAPCASVTWWRPLEVLAEVEEEGEEEGGEAAPRLRKGAPRSH